MSRPSRVRVASVAALATLIAGACSTGDGETEPSFTLPSFSTTTTTTFTTSASTTDDTSTPTASTTATTTVPTTDTVDVTTSTTLPPTTTTTEPLAVQELILRGDGLGSARFGASPDGVIEYVSSILGGTTADTGWVDPLTFAVCDGEIARRVDWGSLSLLFSDLSDVASGRRHFMGYEYGRIGQIGDEPVGLRTDGGTTLGSRVVDLLADYPEAAINRGEEEINIPSNFYVSDNFYGLLTGVESDDVVTVIFGGWGCGE